MFWVHHDIVTRSFEVVTISTFKVCRCLVSSNLISNILKLHLELKLVHRRGDHSTPRKHSILLVTICFWVVSQFLLGQRIPTIVWIIAWTLNQWSTGIFSLDFCRNMTQSDGTHFKGLCIKSTGRCPTCGLLVVAAFQSTNARCSCQWKLRDLVRGWKRSDEGRVPEIGVPPNHHPFWWDFPL